MVFKGEKTSVFWAGLIILGLASVALFSIIWFKTLEAIRRHIYYLPDLRYEVPFIVATVVFILIGLYMMKSGVRRKLP